MLQCYEHLSLWHLCPTFWILGTLGIFQYNLKYIRQSLHCMWSRIQCASIVMMRPQSPLSERSMILDSRRHDNALVRYRAHLSNIVRLTCANRLACQLLTIQPNRTAFNNALLERRSFILYHFIFFPNKTLLHIPATGRMYFATLCKRDV